MNCGAPDCSVCEPVALAGWTVPAPRDRARERQLLALLWHVALYRFLSHAFARRVLDNRRA